MNVEHIADSLISDQLEANITSFLQWSFLGVGGFFNVALNQTGAYGGDESKLRMVDDPRNPAVGSVWEGFRKDWVWESGVEYSQQPIAISGVYVNGSFRPLASGVTIDYPNGRVTLNPPVSSGVVKCQFSYILYQVYTTDHPGWSQIQTNSFRADDPQFQQVGSGVWDVLAENRIQLPAVFVEAVPQTDRFGLQVGDLTHVVRQTVLFNILAEDRWHVKWLHDALSLQQEKRLVGYDKNAMLVNDAFPLDANGSPVPSGLMYPSLIAQYPWRQIRVAKTQSSPKEKMAGIHACAVKWVAEVDV